MTDMQPIIRLRGVGRSFGSGHMRQTVIGDIDLDIYPGTLTVIRGESGTGKTTLLRILGLLDSDFSGTYEIGGVAVDGAPNWFRDELRAQNIGFIFQEGRLFNHQSLSANISLPMLIAGDDEPTRAREVRHQAGLVFRRDELDARVLEKYPSAVSGGQKQRASIMRAMIRHPGIILADEPTASLHPELKGEVVDRLHALRDAGFTVIVVSHDSVFYNEGRQLEVRDKGLIEIAKQPANPLQTNSPGDQCIVETAASGDTVSPLVSLPIRAPSEAGSILWGWRPRAPIGTIMAMALKEAFGRPLFLVLILTSLLLGICQIAVFTSVLIGSEAFIDRTMTQGSRLNRIEIAPQRANMAEDDRFPELMDILALEGVSAVVPRREATLRLVREDGTDIALTTLGLHPNDPEYSLLDFLAGGPFTADHDLPEVILVAPILDQSFATEGLANGSITYDDFIGRTVTVLIPQFDRGGNSRPPIEATLRIAGIIANGEGGRQLYLPSVVLQVFDRLKRDRTGAFSLPMVEGAAEWSDMDEVRNLADWPWQDKLHIYSSEIRQIIPTFGALLRMGFRPESDIWDYKWALDIQDTAWTVFLPLLAMICVVVGITIAANVFTSAKLKESEFALYRVLGMRRGDLVAVQVISTGALCALGALLGLLVGHGLLTRIREMLRSQAEASASVAGAEVLDFDALFAPLGGFALPLFLATFAISLLAALYPAVKASRVDPAKVLGA